jgi:hypothetical protein
MKGKLKESYTKSNGRTIFVYYLQASDLELIAYKKTVGNYYREENYKPLYYTLFFYGNEVSIEKSKNKGNYFVKNDEFEQKKSLVDQFGGNLHQAFFEITKDENWLLSEKNVQFLKKRKNNSKNLNDFEENNTFENYKGSYAQEIEGYSDQDIDDIFDGDPDMYWNID